MNRTVVWAAGYLYSLVNVFIASLQHLFDRVLWETCCLQFSRLSGLLCRLTDKINTQEYFVLKELSHSGELAHSSSTDTSPVYIDAINLIPWDEVKT